MFNKNGRFVAAMASLIVGLGAGSVAVGAAVDNLASTNSGSTSVETILEEAFDFSEGPVQCQIIAESENGVMTLESVVHALTPIQGSYSLMIASNSGGNRSRVQQGGNFAVDMDQRAVLGKVMLGTRGGVYDVSLKISVDGQFMECAEQFEI